MREKSEKSCHITKGHTSVPDPTVHSRTPRARTGARTCTTTAAATRRPARLFRRLVRGLRSLPLLRRGLPRREPGQALPQELAVLPHLVEVGDVLLRLGSARLVVLVPT